MRFLLLNFSLILGISSAQAGSSETQAYAANVCSYFSPTKWTSSGVAPFSTAYDLCTAFVGVHKNELVFRQKPKDVKAELGEDLMNPIKHSRTDMVGRNQNAYIQLAMLQKGYQTRCPFYDFEASKKMKESDEDFSLAKYSVIMSYCFMKWRN